MKRTVREGVKRKIAFLESQLDDARHLPETHDYLLMQLDQQKRILIELEVTEFFASLDQDESGVS